MQAVRVPKRFKLMGQSLAVEYSAELLHKQDARGLAVYRDNTILLQPSVESNPLPQSQVEQTFCHELVHFLFHMAGYPEDREDETKVERVAHLLHQALTTMEHD